MKSRRCETHWRFSVVWLEQSRGVQQEAYMTKKDIFHILIKLSPQNHFYGAYKTLGNSRAGLARRQSVCATCIRWKGRIQPCDRLSQILGEWPEEMNHCPLFHLIYEHTNLQGVHSCSVLTNSQCRKSNQNQILSIPWSLYYISWITLILHRGFRTFRETIRL